MARFEDCINRLSVCWNLYASHTKEYFHLLCLAGGILNIVLSITGFLRDDGKYLYRFNSDPFDERNCHLLLLFVVSVCVPLAMHSAITTVSFYGKKLILSIPNETYHACVGMLVYKSGLVILTMSVTLWSLLRTNPWYNESLVLSTGARMVIFASFSGSAYIRALLLPEYFPAFVIVPFILGFACTAGTNDQQRFTVFRGVTLLIPMVLNIRFLGAMLLKYGNFGYFSKYYADSATAASAVTTAAGSFDDNDDVHTQPEASYVALQTRKPTQMLGSGASTKIAAVGDDSVSRLLNVPSPSELDSATIGRDHDPGSQSFTTVVKQPKAGRERGRGGVFQMKYAEVICVLMSVVSQAVNIWVSTLLGASYFGGFNDVGQAFLSVSFNSYVYFTLVQLAGAIFMDRFADTLVYNMLHSYHLRAAAVAAHASSSRRTFHDIVPQQMLSDMLLEAQEAGQMATAAAAAASAAKSKGQLSTRTVVHAGDNSRNTRELQELQRPWERLPQYDETKSSTEDFVSLSQRYTHIDAVQSGTHLSEDPSKGILTAPIVAAKAADKDAFIFSFDDIDDIGDFSSSLDASVNFAEPVFSGSHIIYQYMSLKSDEQLVMPANADSTSTYGEYSESKNKVMNILSNKEAIAQTAVTASSSIICDADISSSERGKITDLTLLNGSMSTAGALVDGDADAAKPGQVPMSVKSEGHGATTWGNVLNILADFWNGEYRFQKSANALFGAYPLSFFALLLSIFFGVPIITAVTNNRDSDFVFCGVEFNKITRTIRFATICVVNVGVSSFCLVNNLVAYIYSFMFPAMRSNKNRRNLDYALVVCISFSVLTMIFYIALSVDFFQGALSIRVLIIYWGPLFASTLVVSTVLMHLFAPKYFTSLITGVLIFLAGLFGILIMSYQFFGHSELFTLLRLVRTAYGIVFQVTALHWECSFIPKLLTYFRVLDKCSGCRLFRFSDNRSKSDSNVAVTDAGTYQSTEHEDGDEDGEVGRNTSQTITYEDVSAQICILSQLILAGFGLPTDSETMFSLCHTTFKAWEQSSMALAAWQMLALSFAQQLLRYSATSAEEELVAITTTCLNHTNTLRRFLPEHLVQRVLASKTNLDGLVHVKKHSNRNSSNSNSNSSGGGGHNNP